MRGRMMAFPLTVPALLRRTDTFWRDREVVSRAADRSVVRTTYGATLRRARQLAVGLRRAGIRSGDRVATLDETGCVQIQDRSKDLIKSGGEWISSVALESALVAHSAVAEAAVVAIPDDRWQERPLALVVLRPGASVTPEDLRAFLAPQFAKWWLPDGFVVVESLPRTPTGKLLKYQLRERYKDYKVAETGA